MMQYALVNLQQKITGYGFFKQQSGGNYRWQRRYW